MRTPQPSESPPVERLEALSVRKISIAPSVVRRVTVLAVVPITVPVTVKVICRLLSSFGLFPVTERIREFLKIHGADCQPKDC